MLFNFSKLKELALLKVIMSFVIAFLVFDVLVSKVSIGFNDTDSISGRVFLIIKQSYPHQKMDKIIFDINNSHTHHRDKRVLGFEGDTVSRKDNCIFLNQKNIGKIKPKSLSGNILESLIQDGQTVVIPKGYYFVYSPHKDSYDSRYKSIGLISKKRVMGVAYEIF